jgi:subtilisin family serine protease
MTAVMGYEIRGQGHSALFLSMSLALGLAACGGGGGGSASTPTNPGTPAPAPTTDVCTNVPGVQATVPPGYFAQGTTCTLTDACLNYDGLQTEAELVQKAFVRDAATGTCKLEKNHAALATSGFDIARMQGHTGKDVLIYVDDDGFYPIHQEFTGRVAGSARFEYVNGVKVVTEGVWETPAEIAANDHGTGVSSVALGSKVGAAPGARLFAAFGVVDEGNLIQRGAKIINASNTALAGNMLFHSADEFQGLPNHFLVVIKNSQTVYVGAAGNEDADLSNRRDSLSVQNKSCLENPDEASHYLLVGSYNSTLDDKGSARGNVPGTLASYSNYPGYFKPFQDRFLVTGDFDTLYAESTAPDAYLFSYGTSLAAPMVSGALAILLEVNPRITSMQAAQVLLDTADRPARLGYGTNCSSTTAKGIFTSDCGAMKYGRGIMNVPKAIEKAQAM